MIVVAPCIVVVVLNTVVVVVIVVVVVGTMGTGEGKGESRMEAEVGANDASGVIPKSTRLSLLWTLSIRGASHHQYLPTDPDSSIVIMSEWRSSTVMTDTNLKFERPFDFVDFPSLFLPTAVRPRIIPTRDHPPSSSPDSQPLQHGVTNEDDRESPSLLEHRRCDEMVTEWNDNENDDHWG